MWNMCAYVTPFKPHIIAHLTQGRLHLQKSLCKNFCFHNKRLHTMILGKGFIQPLGKWAVKDSNEMLSSQVMSCIMLDVDKLG